MSNEVSRFAVRAARNPVYASADQLSINLLVEFEGLGVELPFTATPGDEEAHGVELFNRAAAGEFGVVLPYVAPLPPVPQVVSRFQARAALHLAGELQAIEAYMALPDTPMLIKLAWQDAREFERPSPTVEAVRVAKGWTSEQVDALFVAATGITA